MGEIGVRLSDIAIITSDNPRTEKPMYTRILAFNDRGRGILNSAKDSAFFVNAGEDTSDPYQAIEQRCGALYGLFAPTPEGPDRAKNERVYYARKYE